MRYVAEVLPPVVCDISVFVIDFAVWPVTSHIEPCKAMGAMLFSTNRDCDAVFRARARYGAGLDVANIDGTGKHPRLLVVTEEPPQLNRGNAVSFSQCSN